MAKKPLAAAEVLPAHVIEKARALLTAAERQIFHSSHGAALAKHTRSQVEAAMRQARILRNKWRDLHQSQARTVKRAGRAAEASNARTREKHGILAGVVDRFEKRLVELKGVVDVAAAEAAPATKGKPRKKSAARPATAASKKASRRVTAGLDPAPAAQLVRFDRAGQRSALAAAKASRIKRGGQGTQRLGHAAASARRAQKRRDVRSRG